MAYDETLAERVRAMVAGTPGLVEKKMFGGLAFLLRGNMSVGVHGDELIVRIDPEEKDTAIKKPGVRMFEVGGRTMKGWLLVGGAAIKDKKGLEGWVSNGVSYAKSLPAKT